MSEGHRNTYLRKVYSHRRQDKRASPVPLFDQVFGMGIPILRDFEQAIDLSVKKVEVETAEVPKTSADKDPMKRKMSIFSPQSTDEDDMIDLLSEGTSCSDTNAEEDISDRELSRIRAHMSNADSAEDVRFSSESLTVTFVLTSATDSSSSAATDSLQPVEMPRQTADASGIEVYSLVNLSADVVIDDEKGYESPQEALDLSGSALDTDEIRSSTPVNNSQIQLQLFDSLSTIAELQNNKEPNEEDKGKEAEIIIDYEEESEEDEDDDEEEEEGTFSHATQNEMTPPRPDKQSACPSISLKHSLRYRKKDKSKKLRSSRCIFPEASLQEQVLVTQSSEMTQQAKESPDYPLGKRQLTSTPIHPVRGNQSHSCLPHPAVSTITISEPCDSSTVREPNEEEATLGMTVANEHQEKQVLATADPAAGHRPLTSTPVSFLKSKIDSCLPPAVSAITILEPRQCIHSAELESNVGVAEPEELPATENEETLHKPCRPSLAESSSESRIIRKSACGRQAKRCRISTDETGPEETCSQNLSVLRSPYLVGPDRWNIPYKTMEGQICEHKDLEVCSIIRLPFVEDNPVPFLQCTVRKSAVRPTSYSSDFLESF